jgi:hypothetical protein
VQCLWDQQQAGATIVGEYRYNLWRVWDASRPCVCFVLLNPSTADAALDDPTLRRCVGFAQSWGAYGSVEIVNLFAYRASNPAMLRKAADPIGPDNDTYLQEAARRASCIVSGWGVRGTFLQRDRVVLALLASYPLYCLRLTRERHPQHPLYVPGSAVLREFMVK